jgi:hypothetical protein
MRNDLLCEKEIEKMGVRFFSHETLKWVLLLNQSSYQKSERRFGIPDPFYI